MMLPVDTSVSCMASWELNVLFSSVSADVSVSRGVFLSVELQVMQPQNATAAVNAAR